MDGTAAIERNREALKNILAGLVAMAGLAAGAGFAPGPRAPLPRHLYLAVLRLLRPAEAAARRLIIAAARGMTLPAVRPRKPSPASSQALTIGTTPAILPNGVGTGIVVTGIPLWRLGLANVLPPIAPKRRTAPAARTPAFPLLDPLRRWSRRPRPRQVGVPRILMLDATEPFPVPPRRPPSPDDPIDTKNLGRRLAALASALDDLPRQAKRFARWQAFRDASRDAVGAQNGAPRNRRRVRRIWPLRLGRPPGSRRPGGRRNVHAVDEVLAAAHALAWWALEHPDTS